MTGPIHAPGMDQAHYTWSPITSRAPLKWASGKPVSLSVVVLVEHVELYPPEDAVQPPITAGIMPNIFAFPNMPLLTVREYGHRVGLFRVLDMLETLNIPATIAIDAMAAARYPYIVEDCANRGAEFVAHGISANRAITSLMPEADEREYIKEALEKIRRSTGASIRGWLSPEQSESTRTPALLDEAGLDYVLDWPNDEQPYYMNTPRRLVSVPTLYDLDDAFYFVRRKFTPASYRQDLVNAFECLKDDGETSARSMVLVVRPWLVGQPFRIGALEQALSEIMVSGAAWAATTGAVVEAFHAAG